MRGRVFAADPKRRLRRARIQLNALELRGENQTTDTNADGRYQFKDLPAGRNTITLTRSGCFRCGSCISKGAATLGPRPAGDADDTGRTESSGADGTFLICDPAPGDYTLRVQRSTNVVAATVEERVIVPISIDGTSLSLKLITTPGI